MFDKFQDALLVLVFFYAIYRVAFVNGVTLVNIFILLCSVVALISTILKHTGYLAKVEEKKKEALQDAEKEEEK